MSERHVLFTRKRNRHLSSSVLSVICAASMVTSMCPAVQIAVAAPTQADDTTSTVVENINNNTNDTSTDEHNGNIVRDSITPQVNTAANANALENANSGTSTTDTNQSESIETPLRLIVLSKTNSTVTPRATDDVVGTYSNAILIQYKSEEEIADAESYYKSQDMIVSKDFVLNVTPFKDQADKKEESSKPKSKDNTERLNAFAIASNNSKKDSEALKEEQEKHPSIALLDTGAPKNTNLFSAETVLQGDALDANGHASALLDLVEDKSFVENISSIQAFDDNGYGSISSLWAAINRAIEQKADTVVITGGAYIPQNDVLKSIAEEAAKANITIIVAAGDDNKDVSQYAPANVETAFTVAACDEQGKIRSSSNKGTGIDSFVKADNSAAAAMLFAIQRFAPETTANVDIDADDQNDAQQVSDTPQPQSEPQPAMRSLDIVTAQSADPLAGDAYAVLSSAGVLTLFRSETEYSAGGGQTVNDNAGNSYTGEVFTGFEGATANTSSSIPWASRKTDITSVVMVANETISPTDTAYWFYGCSNLMSANLSALNTSATTTMSHMFDGCSSMTSVDVSNFDVTSVADFSFMFNDCSNLLTLNLSNFETSSLTNMNSMFLNCAKITEVDMYGFDLRRSVNNGDDNFMGGCANLQRLRFGPYFTFGNAAGRVRFAYSSSVPVKYAYCEYGSTVSSLSQLENRYVPRTMAGYWWYFRYAYASLSDDGTFTFFTSFNRYEEGANVSAIDTAGNTWTGYLYNTDLEYPLSVNNTAPNWLSNATAIKKVQCAGTQTIAISSSYRYFYNCSNLTDCDLSLLDFNSNHNYVTFYQQDMFKGCTSLTRLTVGAGCQFGNQGGFVNLPDKGSGWKWRLDSHEYDSAHFPGALNNAIAENDTSFYGTWVYSYVAETPSSYAYASLDSNGVLTFFRSNNVYSSSASTTAVDVNGTSWTGRLYAGIESVADWGQWGENQPWRSQATTIVKVQCLPGQEISLGTCVNMFYGFSALEELDISSFDMSNSAGYNFMLYQCDHLVRVRFGSKSHCNRFDYLYPGSAWIRLVHESGNHSIAPYYVLYDYDHSTMSGWWYTDSYIPSYAILDDLGTLTFFRSTTTYTAGENMTVVDIDGNTYTGRLYTDIEKLSLSSTSDQPWASQRSQILKVVCAGDQEITFNNSYLFASCSNLKEVHMKNLQRHSDHYSAQYLFSSCSSLESVDVDEWTYGARLSRNMFSYCTSITELDMSQFIGAWNYADYTFYGSYNLTTLNLCNLDLSSGREDYVNMLSGCSSLTYLTLGPNFYFKSSGNFSVNPTGLRDVPWVHESKAWSYHSGDDLSQNYTGDKAGLWIAAPGYASLSADGTLTIFQALGNYEASDNTTVEDIDGNQWTGKLYVGISTARGMYSTACVWYDDRMSIQRAQTVPGQYVKIRSCSYWFNGDTNLGSCDLSSLDTSQCDYFSRTFYGCSNLLELDISNFDTRQASDLGAMLPSYVRRLTLGEYFTFKGKATNSNYWASAPSPVTGFLYNATTNGGYVSARNLQENYDGSKTEGDYARGTYVWRSPAYAVVSGEDLIFFQSDDAITEGADQDVTDVAGNTYHGDVYVSIETTYTSSGTNVKWYSHRLDIKHAFVAEGSDLYPAYFSSWFAYHNNLVTCDLRRVNATRISDMSYSFNYCSSMTTCDLSSFETPSLRSLYQTFYGCQKLTELDLGGFDTTTQSSCRLTDTFKNCKALTKVKLGEKFSFIDSTGNGAALPDPPTGKWINSSDPLAEAVTADQLKTNYDGSTAGGTYGRGVYVAAPGACAVLSDSGELVLFNAKEGYTDGTGTYEDKYGHTYTGQIYVAIDMTNYNYSSNCKWYSRSADITSVRVETGQTITPKSCAYWFYSCSNLTSCDLTGLDTTQANYMGYMFNMNTSTLRYVTFGPTFSFKGKSSNTGTPAMLPSAPTGKWHNTSVTGAANISPEDLTKNYNGAATSGDYAPGTYTWAESGGYAVLTAEGELIFLQSNGLYYAGEDQEITDVANNTYTGTIFTGIETNSRWTYSGYIPWYPYASSIKNVRIAEGQTIETLNCTYWFYYDFKNLKTVDLSALDTSKVTDMSYMFYSATSMNRLNIAGWNTSNVTNMAYMFYYDMALNTLDLSGWNTSNVTNMSSMFYCCYTINNLNISSFNTSNVTNMSGMFAWCEFFYGTLDLSHFNTSKVTNMSSMFEGFAGWNGLANLDISSFDTSKVSNMTNMFASAECLHGVKLGPNFSFKGNNITSEDSQALLPEIDSESVPGANGQWIRKTTGLSYSPEYLRENYTGSTMSDWYYSNDGIAYGVLDDSGALTLFKSQDIVSRATRVPDVTVTDTQGNSHTGILYSNFDQVTERNHPDPVWQADKTNIKTFSVASGYTISPLYTGGWFQDCTELTSCALSRLDTSNVADFYYMFAGTTSLETLDITPLNTTSAQSFAYMFNACAAKTLDFSNFSTGNLTNMNYMFYMAPGITALDLSPFDTSKVVWSAALCWGCTSLKSVKFAPIASFASMSNLNYWFYDCTSLTSVTLPTTTATVASSASYMFFNCSSLTSLDLSGLATPAITSASNMFKGCSSLTTLDTGAIDTSNATSLGSMFSGCTSLRELDISNLNTKKATFMDNMFENCYHLIKVKLGANFSFKGAGSAWCSLPYGGTGKWINTDIEGATLVTASNLAQNYNGGTSGDYGRGTYETELVEYSVYDTEGNGVLFQSHFQYYNGGPQTVEDIAGAVRTGTVKCDITNTNSYSVFNGGKTIVKNMSVAAGSTIHPQTCLSWLYDYSALETVDLRGIDCSATTSMQSMFASSSVQTVILPVSNNNPSLISMAQMFQSATSLTSVTGFENFDTSHVENLYSMFSCTLRLTTLDFSDFNTSGARDLHNMFDTSGLTTLDISDWRLTEARNLNYMFRDCSALTNLTFATGAMTHISTTIYMFSGCSSLTKLDISDLDTRQATNMGYYMFNSCPVLSSIKIGPNFSFYGDGSLTKSTCAVFPYAYNRYWMNKSDPRLRPVETYALADNYDGSLSNTVYAPGEYVIAPTSYGVLDSEGTLTFIQSYETYTASDNATVTDLYNVEHTGRIYTNPENLGQSNDRYDQPWQNEKSQILKVCVAENQHIYPYNVAFWFAACPNLTEFDFTGVDVWRTIRTDGMFSGTSGLTTLDMSGLDWAAATDMSGIFYECSGLTNLDISDWNTPVAEEMDQMFYSCSSLTSLDISSLDTDKVKNTWIMFAGCEKLTSLNLSTFNTSSLERAPSMFANCKALTTMDLSGFSATNLKDIDNMFYNCTSLESVNMSGWTQTSLTNVHALFYGDTVLSQINLTGLDTSNVTDFSYMFYDCPALRSLDISSFNTHKATTMKYMLEDLWPLESLTLGKDFSFTEPTITDTSNQTNMPYARQNSTYSGKWINSDIEGAKSVTRAELKANYDGGTTGNYGRGTYVWAQYALDATPTDMPIDNTVPFTVGGCGIGAALIGLFILKRASVKKKTGAVIAKLK